MNSSVPQGDGSIAAFDRNWLARPESAYTHFTRGEPANQIQLAFRQNWLNFSRLMQAAWGDRPRAGLKALEVGAGRGTMSLYFADAGFDCTMLDTSAAALEIGRKIFADQGLGGRFMLGDVMQIDAPEGAFDVIFSIGLLEHFADPGPALREQIRVLAPQGMLLVYIVPERPDNVQADYNWINDLLRVHARTDAGALQKEEVYRSGYASPVFLEVLREAGLAGCGASGVYPLPMISPSIDFPFTLNPPAGEAVLVREFTRRLAERERASGRPGWLCDEAYGQAFVVWGQKP